MVANCSVKTPTALADLFLDLFRAQDRALDAFRSRIHDGLISKHRTLEMGLQRCRSGISLALSRRQAGMENLLQRCLGRIKGGLLNKYAALQRLSDTAAHRVKFAAGARISQEYSATALREARIRATDPRNILSMGYVLVTGKDNKVLKTVNRVGVGDRIGVRFQDGSLTAKVDQVFSESVDNEKTNIA